MEDWGGIKICGEVLGRALRGVSREGLYVGERLLGLQGSRYVAVFCFLLCGGGGLGGGGGGGWLRRKKKGYNDYHLAMSRKERPLASAMAKVSKRSKSNGSNERGTIASRDHPSRTEWSYEWVRARELWVGKAGTAHPPVGRDLG